jgi:hypothetical protein
MPLDAEFFWSLPPELRILLKNVDSMIGVVDDAPLKDAPHGHSWRQHPRLGLEPLQSGARQVAAGLMLRRISRMMAGAPRVLVTLFCCLRSYGR